jgi:hypothetical protein
VAIKTGYITPYSETEKRSQVIVVLYEDWTVLCYDSSLHLMWSKEVAHKTFDLDRLNQYYHIHSAAIDIAPLQLRDDLSDGVVIVGASMKRREGLTHPDGTAMEPVDVYLHRNSDGTLLDPEAVAKLEHFSIFALDGFSGHVIWKHDGMEVRAEQYSRSLPQHAYTLDLKVGVSALVSVTCVFYGTEVVHMMYLLCLGIGHCGYVSTSRPVFACVFELKTV